MRFLCGMTLAISLAYQAKQATAQLIERPDCDTIPGTG
jgi:hypothetical protein